MRYYSRLKNDKGTQKRSLTNVLGNRKSAPTTAVFLVGFMGAGKTTVGRIVARQLGWEFNDLDDKIERRAGRSVASIFRNDGEAVFRDLEHRELRRLIASIRSGKPRIVALGGGAIVQARNRLLIRRNRFPVVFLDARVEILRRRCLRQARTAGISRPLLGTMAEFRARYSGRVGFYRQASLRAETAGRRPVFVASKLISELGLALHRTT